MVQISPCRIISTDLQFLKLGLGLSSSEMTLKFDDTIQERFVSLTCQVGTDMALNDPCFVLVQPPLKVLPTKESTNSRLKRRVEKSLYWTLNISEVHWSIIVLRTNSTETRPQPKHMFLVLKRTVSMRRSF